MDEKAMILEQEHLQKVKKRKKYKKVKCIMGILVVFLLAGGMWYAVKGRYLPTEADNAGVEIVAGEGQELIYAKIISIKGNEITYTVTEMPVQNMPKQDAGDKIGGSYEGKELPEGMNSPGGMELPDGMSFPEGVVLPDGMCFPEGRELPEGMNSPEMSGGQRPGRGSKETTDKGEEQYFDIIEGESITTYIPVGTAVTTKLGTVTTFSRLEAGDYVALITEGDGEEQMIMAVYIIG
ncbi:MAG: hypothetical protein IJN16_04290 [Lachnospiraceae bacterium]|nr:hypothetical protein [Lachnospiraceae bacterium]